MMKSVLVCVCGNALTIWEWKGMRKIGGSGGGGEDEA